MFRACDTFGAVRSTVGVAVMAVHLLACSGSSADPTSSTTSTTSTGSGMGTGGAAGGTGGGDATKPLTVVASFVPETGAGQAPALLRMANDTPDEILSLTLDDGQPFSFYLIEPLTTTDYLALASDDLFEDAILSLHTLDTCIRKPFESMTGPLVLEPGHAYTMHIKLDEGFEAEIIEEPAPEPYVGIRAFIEDPVKIAVPTELTSRLVLAGPGMGAMGEFAQDDIYDRMPVPYTLFPSKQIEVTSTRFIDLAGGVHESTTPLLLQGAFGYTVYLSDSPVDGATATATLEVAAP